MPTVLFRVDASPRIGSGHFARSAALAHTLLARGCKVHFTSRRLPDGLRKDAQAAGIGMVDLPSATEPAAATTAGYESWLGASWEEDASQTIAAIEGLGSVDWLVADHYGIDGRWESRVRASGERLLVIDDLADRRHECDVLLNHNLLDAGTQRYGSLLPTGTRMLLGPKYAPLREEFVRVRARQVRDTARANRILVFLGGADAQGMTQRVLAAIGRLPQKDIRVTAVLGPLNAHSDEIRRRFGGMSNVKLIGKAANMAELMADADLAVGAGGISNWERCCLGLPSLVVAVAENQIEPARLAAQAGACLYLGEAARLTESGMLDALHALLADQALRRRLSESGLSLVDGRGCERIVDEMLGPRLKVRPASREDAYRVFPWRNAEPVRRASRDSRPLTLEAHLEWFFRAIDDSGRVMLIGEDTHGPLGVLRYDLQGDAATVSIYLDPARQGHGYGTALLDAGESWLQAHRPEIRVLQAEVLPENVRSRRSFAAAGFSQVDTLFRKSLEGRAPSQDTR